MNYARVANLGGRRMKVLVEFYEASVVFLFNKKKKTKG